MQNGRALKYVKNKTNDLCMIAVEQNGMALKYVETQTEELCRLAVINCGSALQYVKNQTYDICLNAVKNDGYALEFVENQTEEICIAAVRNIGIMLQFVKNQTNEINKAAIMSDSHALKYVEKKTDYLCKLAIIHQQNYHASPLQFIEDQTEEICIMAIKKDPRAFCYVINQTDNIRYTAIRKNPDLICQIENPTFKMCELAIVYRRAFDKENENVLDDNEEKFDNFDWFNDKYKPFLNDYILETNWYESFIVSFIRNRLDNKPVRINKVIKKIRIELPIDIIDMISNFLVPPVYKLCGNIDPIRVTNHDWSMFLKCQFEQIPNYVSDEVLNMFTLNKELYRLLIDDTTQFIDNILF
jgi:hypothetical protein